MGSQEETKSWLIVQPRYTLAYADLRAESGTEKLPFDYRIYYFAQAEAELIIDAQTRLVKAPGFILIPPGRAYKLQITSADKTLCLQIKREFIIELATRMGLDWNGREIFFLQSSAGDIPSLRRLCDTLLSEAVTLRSGQQIMLDALLTQIIVQLLRDWMGVRRNPQLEISRVGVVDRRLRRAIEYIHNHYHQELALLEIAQEAFLSEFHFAHLFKRIMGISPHQYLAMVRIEQAKKLIADTDQSIATISLSVGYASQSHFTKIFRSLTGLTPAKYRESIKKI